MAFARPRDPLCAEARALVAPLLSVPGEGRPVVFDADGTLWRGDVGDELLRYLILEDALPRHRGRRELFAEYERRVEVDPALGYAFAVEVMAELEVSWVMKVCEELAERRFAGRIFAYARTLVGQLREAGYDVWVVSASPYWPVARAASRLEIPAERVLAVHCELDAGRLTDRVYRPVPTGEGKVARLQAEGIKPVLAVGNGTIDVPMLRYADRALAVAPYAMDTPLVQVAKEHGWPIQRG